MDIAERERQLRERLGELEARLGAIETELDSARSPDWEERSQESEEDEVLEDLGQAGLAEIARIRAALGRIEAGEYGFCMRCGTEISPERLDILPETPFCKACAR